MNHSVFLSGAPSASKMTMGQGLPPPNQPNKGRIAHPQAFPPYPADHEVSTVDRHACMLVDVHPRLLGETVACRNPSLTPSPRMNNLHSNDT